MQAYLDEQKSWGTQKAQRWDDFLDWLSETGLLTTAVPSRSEGPGKATLDELRSSKAGDKIPREQVQSSKLFTSEYS